MCCFYFKADLLSCGMHLNFEKKKRFAKSCVVGKSCLQTGLPCIPKNDIFDIFYVSCDVFHNTMLESKRFVSRNNKIICNLLFHEIIYNFV